MKKILLGLFLWSSSAFANDTTHKQLCEFAVQEYPSYMTVDSCLEETEMNSDSEGNPEITVLICGNIGQYVTFTDYGGTDGILYGGSGADDSCNE
jgi:hypothetical protein